MTELCLIQKGDLTKIVVILLCKVHVFAITVPSTLMFYITQLLKCMPHKARCFIRANAMQLATNSPFWLLVCHTDSIKAGWLHGPDGGLPSFLILTIMAHTNPIHKKTTYFK
ncbi:hypothetical protein AAZX31_02G167000 [Glycine max]